MKSFYPLEGRRLLALFVGFLLASTTVFAQTTYSLYVGDRQLLSAPKPPGTNSAISQTAWGSSGAHLRVEKYGTTGCYVTCTGYFEGSEEVRCDYYYYWYDNRGAMHTNNATTYFLFKCKPVTVTPSPRYMTLDVGKGQTLTYTYSPSNVSPSPNVRMQSQNTNVATVSNGYVRGVGPGTTTIRLINDMGPDAECEVTVRKIEPTSVSLPSSASVYVGETTTLSASVYPSGASASFNWYSRDSSIARVSSNGVVTGVSEGSTYIYATTTGGLTSNDCRVDVSYRRPTSVSISPVTLSLPIGQSKTLSATVSPSNARYELSWDVSPKGIVDMTSDGRITAKKAGNATVTVSTDNGCKASCKVSVPPDPSGVKLPDKIALAWHKSRKLICTVSPSDAYAQLTWSSADPSVVQVASDGTVRAIAPGKTKVTVKTQNGKSASCDVEVDEPVFIFKVWMRDRENMEINMTETPAIHVLGDKLCLKTKRVDMELDTADVYKFTFEDRTKERMPECIDMEEYLVLYFKESKRLDISLQPSGYDILTNLVWKSSAPEIVSVSQDGILNALAPGEADITVSATNGTCARCHVYVPEPDYHLFVWLTDGSYHNYSFRDAPKTFFDGDDIVITTLKGEYSYDCSSVWKITLSDNESPEPVMTGVSEIRNENNKLLQDEESIVINGLGPNEKLLVYDLQGHLIKTFRSAEGGIMEVCLSTLPTGIYIFKTEKKTFKIIRK